MSQFRVDELEARVAVLAARAEAAIDGDRPKVLQDIYALRKTVADELAADSRSLDEAKKDHAARYYAIGAYIPGTAARANATTRLAPLRAEVAGDEKLAVRLEHLSRMVLQRQGEPGYRTVLGTYQDLLRQELPPLVAASFAAALPSGDLTRRKAVDAYRAFIGKVSFDAAVTLALTVCATGASPESALDTYRSLNAEGDVDPNSAAELSGLVLSGKPRREVLEMFRWYRSRPDIPYPWHAGLAAIALETGKSRESVYTAYLSIRDPRVAFAGELALTAAVVTTGQDPTGLVDTAVSLSHVVDSLTATTLAAATAYGTTWDEAMAALDWYSGRGLDPATCRILVAGGLGRVSGSTRSRRSRSSSSRMSYGGIGGFKIGGGFRMGAVGGIRF